MYQVDNAVIMAAGASSRFAPLSYEIPKGLVEVHGEILIERQIRQLQNAGIPEIYVVVGYKAEQFTYLAEKFGVHIIYNNEYLTRNNHSSIYAARRIIRNSFICSADNYFTSNPFASTVDESYYAAVYASGATNEWCLDSDENGYINHVQVGGADAWYMLGHVFWSEPFSRKFLEILDAVYDLPETRNLFWEDIFRQNLSSLKMKIRHYSADVIHEFDSIDELRLFDTSYVADTRSGILKKIAEFLGGTEAEITAICPWKGKSAEAEGICFIFRGAEYIYRYADETIGEKSNVGKDCKEGSGQC